MINTDSVEEAVEYAERFKKSGRTYLFRGQSRDNYSIISSLARLGKKEQDLAIEKLERFKDWLVRTPGLGDLPTNLHKAIGVAQHYRMATNFIDFTTEPKIAGYFASEKAGPDRADDHACIICLDVEDFNKFCKEARLEPQSLDLFSIDVSNLWRLRAQHGWFLFCRYCNLEEMLNRWGRYFIRIRFPNTHVFSGVRPEEIYPQTSPLEIRLEQFFMNESLGNGNIWLKTLPSEMVYRPTFTDTIDSVVFEKGLPEHSSWSDDNLQPWHKLPADQFDTALPPVPVQILLPNLLDLTDLIRTVSEIFRSDLKKSDLRSKIIAWDVILNKDYNLPEDFSSQISQRLACLWDGLRTLPYSNEELGDSIGMCIALAVAIHGDLGPHVIAEDWECAVRQCLLDPVEMEFAKNDGSYSRGYASAAGFRAAVRPDIREWIADKYKDQLDENIEGILQIATVPKRVYDFRRLASLFARELTPYQVLARSPDLNSSEQSGRAVFYSPAGVSSIRLPTFFRWLIEKRLNPQGPSERIINLKKYQ